MTLARRIVAELVGTALLLAAVVGSGIMGERLAGGPVLSLYHYWLLLLLGFVPACPASTGQYSWKRL
jgi:hypothetical protein